MRALFEHLIVLGLRAVLEQICMVVSPRWQRPSRPLFAVFVISIDTHSGKHGEVLALDRLSNSYTLRQARVESVLCPTSTHNSILASASTTWWIRLHVIYFSVTRNDKSGCSIKQLVQVSFY